MAQVHIGKRTLQKGSEVTHRSDGSLEFKAPIKEILENGVQVTGADYGFSTDLEVVPENDNTGIAVPFFDFGGTRQGNRRDLTVHLTAADGSGIPKLHGRSVFVTFSDKVYEMPSGRWNPDAQCSCRSSATFEVPIEDVKADSVISVEVPFLGASYVASSASHQAVGVTRIELLEDGDPTVWGIVGWGLGTPGIVVYTGKRYDASNGLATVSGQLLTLSAPKAELAGKKKALIFVPGYLEPVTLSAPTVPAPKKAPKVTNRPSIAANSSASVLFKEEGAQVSKVVFEGAKLETQQTKQGLRVFLTRAVTKHQGAVELLGYWGEESFIMLELIVK